MNIQHPSTFSLSLIVGRLAERGVDIKDAQTELLVLSEQLNKLEDKLSNRLFEDAMHKWETLSTQDESRDWIKLGDFPTYGELSGFLQQVFDEGVLMNTSMLDAIFEQLSSILQDRTCSRHIEDLLISNQDRELQYANLLGGEGCESLTGISIILSPKFANLHNNVEKPKRLIDLWNTTQLMEKTSSARHWNYKMMDIALIAHALVCENSDYGESACWRILDEKEKEELF